MGSLENTGKVLIIGAGLAGLALAQILHGKGVPFEIFERDENTKARFQGWAVALHECLAGLDELLPPDTAKELYTCSVNHNTGDYDAVGFMNAHTGEKVGSAGGVAKGQPGFWLRASRSKVRNFLWNANGLKISTGRTFSHYTQDKDSVTAFFTDGSSERGSVLVGADGAHSRVFDGLIGKENHKPELSVIAPLFGEVYLPPALYEPIRNIGKAVCLAGGAAGRRQQLGMLRMEEDRSRAYYFWCFTWRRDYYPQLLGDWVQHASQRELYDFILDTNKDVHPMITDVVRYGGPECVMHPPPKFFEFVPPESLPDGRVTVLGDAAHTMVPFRAAGANTALLDSCDLGRLLVRAWTEGRDLATVIKPYHEVMIPRGRYNVLSSREAAEEGGDLLTTWSETFLNGRAAKQADS